MRITTENPFTIRFFAGRGPTGARGLPAHKGLTATRGLTAARGPPAHECSPPNEGLAMDARQGRIQAAVRYEPSLAPDPPPSLQRHQQAGRQQEQSELEQPGQVEAGVGE